MKWTVDEMDSWWNGWSYYDVNCAGSTLASKYTTRVEVTAVENPLAYYGTALITSIKSFTEKASGFND